MSPATDHHELGSHEGESRLDPGQRTATGRVLRRPPDRANGRPLRAHDDNGPVRRQRPQKVLEHRRAAQGSDQLVGAEAPRLAAGEHQRGDRPRGRCSRAGLRHLWHGSGILGAGSAPAVRASARALRAPRAASSESTVTRATATHTTAKPTQSALLTCSPSTTTPTSSWRSGVMNCIRPTVTSGMRRAAAAKNSKGTAVTTPASTSSERVRRRRARERRGPAGDEQPSRIPAPPVSSPPSPPRASASRRGSRRPSS